MQVSTKFTIAIHLLAAVKYFGKDMKVTSQFLASSIGVAEMIFATRKAIGTSYEVLWLYLEVALLYLLMSSLVTWLQRISERKLNAMVGKEAVKRA